MNEQEMLAALLKMLGDRESTNHGQGCMCSKCCACTTDPMMEQGAAAFIQRANHVAATAMEQFQERVNAQSAALIRMQADITLDKRE